MGWRRWTWCVWGHKNKLTLRKTYFFVIEKYIGDVKQDEKHVPDLLEAIMRPTCLVKEELRQNLFKMTQFRPKIQNSRLQLFGFRKSYVFPPEANARLLTP